ncbi:MAG TPA: hypothetical protein EYQ60_08045 [Myxococcales bacterium]|nr:hypothetical protein [Myxococcales bacterium]
MQQDENEETTTTADFAGSDREEIAALAAILPRALIAEEIAEPIAGQWIGSRNKAVVDGHPAFARHEMNAGLAVGLFHARRARHLVRGLEGAAAALEAEQAGLNAQLEARGCAETRRISRLLILSQDGAPRFFRQVEKLEERFARRLAVLILECDEESLGEAAFGPGKKARALLINHKQAVIRLLLLLDWSESGLVGDVSD